MADIRASDESTFRPLHPRVNLSPARFEGVRWAAVLQLAVASLVSLSFILGSVVAPTTTPTFAANQTTDEERSALEEQLKQLESQIEQYEGQVVGYQKQGKNLKGEIGRLNDKIAQLNLKIKAINLSLRQLDQKISDTQDKITVTEDKIGSHREVLAHLLRNLYESETESLIEIFLKKPRLSDFFNDLNSISLLQGNVQFTIAQITDYKNQLTEQKEQLALARADASTIKAYQEAQREETDQVKKQKNELLEVTKGQESKYQALLKVTKETAAQIRSRIFQLLGGGELSFEQAYEYAKLASGATGVRPALILAVLDRESALGRNVGRCSYKTAMSPKNQEIFLELTSKLNISPDSVTVSCPNADGIYGGAMGPAQFIPSTWLLYEQSVSRVTGHTPPNPWNNADAFVAAALYLKDAGAERNERVAAAKYYCGTRWNRYICTSVYGRKVIEQAARFEQDIAAILSS